MSAVLVVRGQGVNELLDKPLAECDDGTGGHRKSGWANGLPVVT